MQSRITRRAFSGLAAAASSAFLTRNAFAQTALPATITLVVPFAAGGATDIVSRLVSKKVSESLKRSIVIENVGGGGGVVGAARVARSAPDGATLLMATIATHALNPLMAKQPLYDPVKDFTPISMVATVPNVLMVGNQVKAHSVAELITLLKADPATYNYASSGNGTPPHLSGELFKAQAGVKMEHVPYRGGSPAMNDLMGGQIPIMFDVLSGAASFIKSGAVRALAVTTKTRSPLFPELPTMAESGLPDYETYTWNAVFGPAGMPKPMVDLLSNELRLAVVDPEIQQRLRDLSADPVGSTPDELASQVRAEITKWTPIIQAAGLKLE